MAEVENKNNLSCCGEEWAERRCGEQPPSQTLSLFEAHLQNLLLCYPDFLLNPVTAS